MRDLMELTPQQLDIVQRPCQDNDTLFVAGPIGAGKSTALWHRLLHLLQLPVRGESVLFLVPDRGLRDHIESMLTRQALVPHGRPTITTYYGLARRMVDLFWPAIAAEAGFAHPERDPVFLTYETAQFLMYQVIQPLMDEHAYFHDVRVRPRRLTSQLLDNLNKAAINDFPYTEIRERLAQANPTASEALYWQAQECLTRFRRLCLERNALDVSLVIEVFHRYLLPNPIFWAFFSRHFRHLIVDNVEETVPVEQDLIRRMLKVCDSAVLAYDIGGGYRILLGVDPEGAWDLRQACRHAVDLDDAFVPNRQIAGFASRLAGILLEGRTEPEPSAEALRDHIHLYQTTYRSDMIRWVGQQAAALVESGVPPAEIAIIAPYVDGVLRFGLQEALRSHGIPFRILRRWTSFRDDAVVRALLTLSALAHPEWERFPQPQEVAEALSQLIPDLDLVRAALLVSVLYEPRAGLKDAGELDPHLRERIGFAAVERYQELYQWIKEYIAGQPLSLDRFLSRFFEEVLCAKGFWPPENLDAHRACSRLMESARKFRWAAPALGGLEPESPQLGRHYLEMIDQGVVAARYIERAQEADAPAVLIAPVYAYLLENHSSDVHFWVDVGAPEWWRPPHQPLTNPIVLSRRWQAGQTWDMDHDLALRNRLMVRMVEGLARRCRRRAYLCASDISSIGLVQDGPFLTTALRVLAGEVQP
ncbi:MAG: ATP-dependent helicase [Anaerolineae bacterium]|nr:ATP-dependent helicase [Anaerolineae bacterium]